MQSATAANQLSFDLFATTAPASSGFTLDAPSFRARPILSAAEEPPDALPVIPDHSGDFRLTGERALASTWKARAYANLAAIRLAGEIARENRPATFEEQQALIRFVGFGASDLANGCFVRPGVTGFRPGWEGIGDELKTLVSADAYAALARCTQYAHYTPEWVARAVWDALSRPMPISQAPCAPSSPPPKPPPPPISATPEMSKP